MPLSACTAPPQRRELNSNPYYRRHRSSAPYLRDSSPMFQQRRLVTPRSSKHNSEQWKAWVPPESHARRRGKLLDKETQDSEESTPLSEDDPIVMGGGCGTASSLPYQAPSQHAGLAVTGPAAVLVGGIVGVIFLRSSAGGGGRR